MEKDVVVFGMGRFGRSVALQLEANGCKVLAVDTNEEKVQSVSEYVTAAVCAPATDEEAMEELGIRNFDTAIIAIGHNLEASILVTMWCKENGVRHVIAKAFDELQGKVLKKVGADDVIFPEYEMGKRLANNLTLNNISNAIEITDDYSVGEITSPKKWLGKEIKNLKLREQYRINIIAIKHGSYTEMNPTSDYVIKNNDLIVILGSNDMLKKLVSQIKK